MVHSGPQERPSIPTELEARLAVACEGSQEDETQRLGQLADDLDGLRVILKSGDYCGSDLMRAWCAMRDASAFIRASLGEARTVNSVGIAKR